MKTSEVSDLQKPGAKIAFVVILLVCWCYYVFLVRHILLYGLYMN